MSLRNIMNTLFVERISIRILEKEPYPFNSSTYCHVMRISFEAIFHFDTFSRELICNELMSWPEGEPGPLVVDFAMEQAKRFARNQGWRLWTDLPPLLQINSEEIKKKWKHKAEIKKRRAQYAT